MTSEQLYEMKVQAWINDWCLFAEEAMGASLDNEQKEILRSVQFNKMTSVASGTARGKDFIAAVAAVCFLYLIPDYIDGRPESTKVAMTAPTDRQIKNIIVPEIARAYHKLKANGICPLKARLVAYDIRTENEDYFLTGFKADEHQHEAWSGFHAANTMFVVTEASGIAESIYTAIEGNLQGNSRLLLVFNNNNGMGYAAESQNSPRFKHFRLSSLTAPNVLQKKIVIPGQVDYEWVLDKVQAWCTPIAESDFLEDEGDFRFERLLYRPNDIFRVKVLGLAPKVASDVLVPIDWIYAANKRWRAVENAADYIKTNELFLGVDVAGMGRDSSAFCFRYKNYVSKFDMIHSGGTANHMQIAGRIKTSLHVHTSSASNTNAHAMIDTIGEGAGVYSRLVEEKVNRVHSVKFSAAPEYHNRALKDFNNVYEFNNMRAYCYWAVRDWLNPLNKFAPMLPPDDELTQELTGTRWEFRGDGKIQIESKDEIKKRLHRSPDKADALANTFFRVRTREDEEASRRALRILGASI